MNRIKRPVAATVLFTFLAMVLQPLSALAQDRPQSAASRGAAESGEEKFSRTLNEIHEILKEVAPQAAMPHMFPRKKGEMELRAIGPNMKIEVEAAKHAPGVDVTAKVSQLRMKAKEFASLEQHVRAGFDDTARFIKEKNLPAEIVARHEEALRTYEARAAEFKVLLGAVERSAATGGAPLQTALNDLAAFMAKYPNAKAHKPVDPNNLPTARVKPVERKPFTTSEQFKSSGLFDAIHQEQFARTLRKQPVRLAQAGSFSGIPLPSAAVPATPETADLAETEDVQITPAMRNLVASLGNNPVAIYKWVRNNIHFVPTYGSVQGSDITLQSLRGNAFDTASLLIALLRAANIPARYVYGTVQIPADRAMNWVGGVSGADLAADLMGQGGIPVVSVTSGGRITSLRFEHIWVEAWVDYIPSRGAVNRVGDTWVPMDASYKQYAYAAPLDIQSLVPFDADALVAQTRAGATINEQEGWALNVDGARGLQALTDYENRVKAYLDQNKPDADYIDLLGTKEIVEETFSILAGTLPYRIIVQAAKFASLSDNLRHKVTISLFGSEFERADGSPQISYTTSLAALRARRLGVHFAPASPADAQMIDAAVTGGATSLNAYLIRVLPHIQVDGSTLTQGSVVTLGTPQIWDVQLTAPGMASVPRSHHTTAGDEMVFAVNGNGIAPSVLINRMARVPSSTAGENLYAAAYSYWIAHDWFDWLAARNHQVVTYRSPSAALASAPLTTRYMFGIPRSGSYLGRQLDASSVVVAAVGPSEQAKRAFLVQAGMQGSQWEASAFNSVFIRPQGRGISAVEFLTAANMQGIPIYSVTPANVATALPALQVSATVKADISSAVAVGRIAIVPQREPVVSGAAGAGYIILDPLTGEGAYLIDFGLNGGGQKDCGPSAQPQADPAISPEMAFLVGGFVDTVTKQATKQLAPQAARALLPRLLPLLIASIAGGKIVIGVAASLLLPVAVAVLLSVVILLALRMYQLALLEAEIEAGDATRTRTDELDCKCKPEPKPAECQCQIRQRPHLGGDAVHNACADQPQYNGFPGSDTCITPPGQKEKCFDASSGLQVYEIKTHNCRPGSPNNWCNSPFLQDIDRAEIATEASYARQCNVNFSVIVGDPGVFTTMQGWGIANVILDTGGLCRQP